MSVPLITSLADAIQRQEGWSAGSVSQRNNNPGNIMDLAYYKSTGQWRAQNYPTYEAGRQALESLVGNYISQGLNLNEFFAKYAPKGHGGNSPEGYANNVAGWVGIDTNTPLNELQGSYTGKGSGGSVYSPPVIVAGGGASSGDSGSWEGSDSTDSLASLWPVGSELTGEDWGVIAVVGILAVGFYVALS